jgi:hypothetical protein
VTPLEALLEGFRLSADIEAGQRKAFTREYTDRRAREIELDLKFHPPTPNVKVLTIGHVTFATDWASIIHPRPIFEEAVAEDGAYHTHQHRPKE